MSKGDTKKATQNEFLIGDKQRQASDKLMGGADELSGIAMPGMKTAMNYWGKIASGDPGEIFRAIAPATEQISAANTQTKQNIDQTMPRGGERALAKEMSDINAQGQVGDTATKAYTSAFPALMTGGATAEGLSLNEIANALGALSGSANTYGKVADQGAAGKAATMGMFGQLGQAVGSMVPGLMPEGGGGGGGGSSDPGILPCWIAEKLYGEAAAETKVLRYWLTNVWAQKSKVGAVVVWLYRKVGRRVATWVEKYRLVRFLLKPLFDRGVKRAQREMSALLREGGK